MRLLLAALLLLPASIDTLPLPGVAVMRGFEAPAHAYGSGHRGLDLAASPGAILRAPITGHIAFAGRVGDKDVVTLQDGQRVVTLEPATTGLHPGTLVGSGMPFATVGHGGHCSLRCLHVGLRVDGQYLPPWRTRARLLPS